LHLEELEARALLSATVLDPGFETPFVGTNSYQYAPAGSPWTFNGGAGLTGNGSGFTAGSPNAPEGSQVAFVQQTGSVSQAVNFSAGGSFTVSFLATQRVNWQSS
jgi:hypothetical protein